MPKLLIDANISYRIKKKLINVYEDVLHVTDIDLPQPAKDFQIWNWAKVNNFLIVTQDTDFGILQTLKGFPPKLVFLKMGNQSTQLITDVLISAYQKIVYFEKNTSESLIEFIL